jgi:hypothetical protein
MDNSVEKGHRMSDGELSPYEREEIRLREKELQLRELETKASIERERRKLWRNPLLVAVVGGVLTLTGNAYVSFQQTAHQFELTFAQQQTRLALQVLQRAPTSDTASLRAWAVDVLDYYSRIPLSVSAREELRTTPLRPSSESQR